MPIDYKEYHPKWRLISKLIRFKRAHNRCEQCGLVNGQVIKRLKNGMVRTPGAQDWDMINAKVRYSGYTMSGSIKFHGFTKVVLTVAHLDHNKANNRFENLAALCQRCHLSHDQKQHAENRKYGRNWKRDQFKLDI